MVRYCVITLTILILLIVPVLLSSCGGGDPIISATASSLIRDRIARNFGLAFEFIFLGIIPALYFITVLWYVIALSTQPIYISHMMGINELMRLMDWVNSASYVIMDFGYIFGLFVLIWPGLALVRKEFDGDWFRFMPLETGRVFKSLLLVQMISFAIYPVIMTVLMIGTNIYILDLLSMNR